MKVETALLDTPAPNEADPVSGKRDITAKVLTTGGVANREELRGGSGRDSQNGVAFVWPLGSEVTGSEISP